MAVCNIPQLVERVVQVEPEDKIMVKEEEVHREEASMVAAAVEVAVVMQPLVMVLEALEQ
jgi:hypothetical protein